MSMKDPDFARLAMVHVLKSGGSSTAVISASQHSDPDKTVLRLIDENRTLVELVTGPKGNEHERIISETGFGELFRLYKLTLDVYRRRESGIAQPVPGTSEYKDPLQ